jgi:hypothetical protein
LSQSDPRLGYARESNPQGSSSRYDQVMFTTLQILQEKKNGRHEETRTPDLYRVKVAL